MTEPLEPQPSAAAPAPRERRAACLREKVSTAIVGGIVVVTLALLLVAAFEAGPTARSPASRTSCCSSA
jgi:hypothetical protein